MISVTWLHLFTKCWLCVRTYYFEFTDDLIVHSTFVLILHMSFLLLSVEHIPAASTRPQLYQVIVRTQG